MLGRKLPRYLSLLLLGILLWGQDGHAQGIEEARAEALDNKRTLLLAMLEAKFGEVDDATVEAIEATLPGHLDRWFLGLLEASSLAELLKCVETPPVAKQTA